MMIKQQLQVQIFLLVYGGAKQEMLRPPTWSGTIGKVRVWLLDFQEILFMFRVSICMHSV